MIKLKRILLLLPAILIVFFQTAVWAEKSSQNLTPASLDKGMTLWQLLTAGGLLMFVLAAMSLVALAFIVYNFIYLKKDQIAPAKFADEILVKLEKGDDEAVRRMAETQKNVFSNIILIGLDRKDKGKTSPKEAMENAARKEIGSLWQNINYLADIATISPLVGLLGTVFGMIQAFNSVAFQTGFAKPTLLAGGVAKAMVTTAGGLFVAIPALSFYSYFKVKVQEITSIVETYTNEMTQHISDKKVATRRKPDAKD